MRSVPLALLRFSLLNQFLISGNLIFLYWILCELSDRVWWLSEGSTEKLDTNVMFNKFAMSSGPSTFLHLGFNRNGTVHLLLPLADTHLQNVFGLYLMLDAVL